MSNEEQLEQFRRELVLKAPHEIPDWFKAVMREKPPEEPKCELIGYAYEDWLKWIRTPHYERKLSVKKKLHHHTIAHIEALKEYKKTMTEYAREIDRQRIAQWPWYYADMIIKAGRELVENDKVV